MARLIDNSYGKCEVRLTKVMRDGSRHTVLELAVRIMLGGAFERLYTHGDNSACIPTDTMKNTVYALAKRHRFDAPERLAHAIVDHFLERFAHIAWCEVSVEQTPWSRIPVDGRPHDFAFTIAATDRRTALARGTRDGAVELRGGLTGLEVLKSSGSSFTGYIKDEYTTLPEATERIFATSVDASWRYANAGADFNSTFEEARRIMLEVFALHDSRSVQETIFAIGERLLARLPVLETVDLAMPNRHRLLVNLAPFGLDNANEIFVPTSEPFGLIKGSVARE